MIWAFIGITLGAGMVGWGLKSWRLSGTDQMFALLRRVHWSLRPIGSTPREGYTILELPNDTLEEIAKIVKQV